MMDLMKDSVDWEEEFNRMKRWYYRICDGCDGDEEDFYLAFLSVVIIFTNGL